MLADSTTHLGSRYSIDRSFRCSRSGIKDPDTFTRKGHNKYVDWKNPSIGLEERSLFDSIPDWFVSPSAFCKYRGASHGSFSLPSLCL
ncbi:hypothetical protein CEXT_66161 [Caerostris extrusa]|uniref:Uncharacterized protein n=1 Tax=Caerostris extrusa TaxID=172846 RepID=A0AAV4V6T5_CAEEX|nr:hypothetical protein CEXT_66161 [Caerostris extrusa]